ncbi:MAG: DUF1553 domain-containing protein [Acidobacteria bacterium]|nr:DUF1553 domain-containing protein [Acidobacteriota bacterium]
MPFFLSAADRPRLSFVKDIVPIFTKSGCANSNCHGSIRGQAGFKLSLFGYEPDLDYDAIIKDGRRVSRKQPEKSLILQKPAFKAPHGGGQRFREDSLEYAAILDWIRDGATYDSAGSPRLQTLRVIPEEQTLIGIGAKLQLRASATYTDGQTEDVTRKVQYTPNDESVLEVFPSGEIRTRRAGETAIMVRTLGKAVAVRIAVVANPPMKDYPEVSGNNFIDELVFAKLRRLNIVPSARSTDHEFLRRVYLDAIGVLPTLEDTAAFLESPDPHKRVRLIDQLLQRPEYAEVWATRFADLYRVGLLDQGSKGASLLYNWLRQAVREDKPYDLMATELITASGNLFYNPTANFYYITERSEPDVIATNISQVFLGVRLECARCHNHPWEKWTQDDFWGFSAFFARMGVKDTYQGDESQILLKDAGEVIHPRTKKPVRAKYLDGPTQSEGPDEDIRENLAGWITAPDNPWFARALVNRVWKHHMGRGLVEPVDDFRVTNPPSNQALLDALARDFVSHGYSLRHLVRQILNSAAYQLSSEPNDTNRQDAINYSRYYVRRLMAEQLMDALVQITGIPEKYPSFRKGTRAMALPEGAPSYFLKTFGRMPAREKICERDDQPDVAQAMHLISGETLHNKITASGGALDRWLADPSLDDDQVVRRLFLSAGLPPRPLPLCGACGRRERLEDVLWAILNSKEFLHNH